MPAVSEIGRPKKPLGKVSGKSTNILVPIIFVNTNMTTNMDIKIA